eukprot:7496252-Alexandrium_andersonii.AAC.1
MAAAAVRASPPAAAGVDGWAPRELATIGDLVAPEAASLLRNIERRGVWPASRAHALSICIPKPQSDVFLPESTR